MKLTKNDKCQVRKDHPHHPSRIGYIEILKAGPDRDCLVLRVEQNPSAQAKTLFVVSRADVTSLEYPEGTR